jgi:hypothetical protein
VPTADVVAVIVVVVCSEVNADEVSRVVCVMEECEWRIVNTTQHAKPN